MRRPWCFSSYSCVAVLVKVIDGWLGELGVWGSQAWELRFHQGGAKKPAVWLGLSDIQQRSNGLGFGKLSFLWYWSPKVRRLGLVFGVCMKICKS